MFRVINALVCDHVRKEVDGKYTCIGIYPNHAISLPDFTSPIVVSFYIEIDSALTQEIDAHFILEDRVSNAVYNSFSSRIRLSGWASPPLASLPMEIRAVGPSTVHFSAIAGGQKIELVNFSIFDRPTA